MAEEEGITVKKSEDFSEWYAQVVLKSALADYAPTQGCIVFREYSYAVWENIRAIFDRMIKSTGHKNAYFPMFIPEAFLKKEAEHFEGFVPEVAWVTHGGESKLEERLAIRPTSETIIYSMYSKWIRSWRDLPLKLNQWCNIVRWEAATKPFLRTREFLWQEGHTAHATEKEAEEEVMEILGFYKDLIENYLAIPVLTGVKSDAEKFKGAVYTTTLETLMSDGRALQCGTSHNLGQNFSKPFRIKFLDKNEKDCYAWQTSWGISTRLLGALVMTHGDDKGLVLPPEIAPTQLVVVPIYYDKDKQKVIEKAQEIADELGKEFRTELDTRDYTPGWKFNYWELKGVPIRVEIGPKDIEKKQVVLVRRDTGKKEFVKQSSLSASVRQALKEMQKDMLAKARKFVEENTKSVKDYKQFKTVVAGKGGFVKACWCNSDACEKAIKDETGATIRLIPFERERIFADCVYCGKKATKVAYFAKAY